MTPPVQLPDGFLVEKLTRAHPRSKFCCGEPKVDEWLKARALQHQKKHLSVTKGLLDTDKKIAGFYTLAMGQINFSDLPIELAKSLPKRFLPVAVLAWLGISQDFQGLGLGKRLFGHALRDLHQSEQVFPFIAVVLDCINEDARHFYKQFGFEQLPGHPLRLFLSTQTLNAMMENL